MSNSVGKKEIQSDFNIYKYSFFPIFIIICKGLYVISSDVSAGMLSAHKEYKTMATQHFTPTKSILPNHCTY